MHLEEGTSNMWKNGFLNSGLKIRADSVDYKYNLCVFFNTLILIKQIGLNKLNKHLNTIQRNKCLHCFVKMWFFSHKFTLCGKSVASISL